MYTNNAVLDNYQIAFPLDRLAPLDKILFLDIETTGLSPVGSQLYMIGLAFYKSDRWHIEQWMAGRPSEERELLLKLAAFLPQFTHIIHFNGNRFDIPYLIQKAREHFVELDFDAYQGIDIYKRVAPLKKLLALPDCRQKTIEQFLGINRIDKYTGGELIRVYKAYTLSPNDTMLELLIQHNYDDMKGMLDIVSILSYSELFTEELPVSRVEMTKSHNMEGNTTYELSMTLKLPVALPKELFAHYDSNFLHIEKDRAIIKVPVFKEELKFFYSNYKDYYYIPSLDSAFHKSVSGHVDSSLRKQASPGTCYTRKEGIFLKQYDILVEPFFKKDYKEKESYFEITAETKANRKLFQTYANHIIQIICNCK